MITEIKVVPAESRGGTTEAPNNLPLGVQPLGDVQTQSSPNQVPVGSSGGNKEPAGSWTNQQIAQAGGPGEGLGGTGYGGLTVGSPAGGYAGLKAADGGGPVDFQSGQQPSGAVPGTGYGGVTVAPVVQDPQIGPHGK